MKENTNTPKPTKAVVSVKLDTTEQNEIQKAAQEKGVTTSDYLRGIISDAKQTNALASTDKKIDTAANPASEKVVSESILSDESVLLLADVVSKVISASISKPLVLSPDREHLRKLAGKEPEQEQTLSVAEEAYLQTLNEAIRADVTETLLLEHNCVPYPHGSPIKQRLFKQMLEKRNEVVSEKIPSLISVLQDAVIKAFHEDCNRMWNRNLFKSTYGIDYNEYKAVYTQED